MYYGDIVLGQTIEFTFTTRQFTTGVPFTLAGTPSLEVYETGNTTPITAGITLTVDYSGVTGLNHVSIVASGGNGFAVQNDHSVVIAAGTIDGVSVVGETIGAFSIENRSALRPTTAGRTLDVSAAGNAGIDWANVEAPTTSLNLSGTTISVSQVIASVSGAIGSVATGGIVAASFAAGALDAVWSTASRTLTSFGTLVADVATAVWGAGTRTLTAFDASFKTGYALSSAGVQAIWDALTSALTTVGSIGKLLVDNINATISSRATQTSVDDIPTNAEFAARTLPSADYGTAANQATINTNVLARATPADVNAQVLDVLVVDTFGEPTGVPPATDTLANKIGRNAMALRNEVTVDANTGKKQFHDDAGNVEWEKDFTDAAGVYNESEANAP